MPHCSIKIEFINKNKKMELILGSSEELLINVRLTDIKSEMRFFCLLFSKIMFKFIF